MISPIEGSGGKRFGTARAAILPPCSIHASWRTRETNVCETRAAGNPKWLPTESSDKTTGHQVWRFALVVRVVRPMSVNQWAEVEVKLQRLCQEFSNIHRGTVKTIFQLVRISLSRSRPGVVKNVAISSFLRTLSVISIGLS